MKVSKIFHYLYFSVMALPLILIPVFMIYSHRHQIDSYTIDVPQNEIVDFNQTIPLLNGSHVYFNMNVNVSIENENIHIYGTSNYVSGDNNDYSVFSPHNVIQNHKYYISSTSDIFICYSYGSGNSTQNFDYIFTADHTGDSYLSIRPYNNELIQNGTVIDDTFQCMFIDFTQMFGSGNEPTIQEFKSLFTNDYYKYTTSKKTLIKDVGTITYDDTDILSQFTYNLYNSVDKYFNVSQFFGLNNLWDFMVLNWFGGNVTIYLEIFWQLLCYWLVVSIAWLIFDLFMYLPNLAHRWLDRGAIE